MDMDERIEQLERLAAMAEPTLIDVATRTYDGTVGSAFAALVAMSEKRTGEVMKTYRVGTVAPYYVTLQEFREQINYTELSDDQDIEFTEDDFDEIDALDVGEETIAGWCIVKRVAASHPRRGTPQALSPSAR